MLRSSGGFRHLVRAARGLLSGAGSGRDVALLSGSTAIGHLLAIVASPVLTRMYAPDDFGLLSVFASLLGVTSVVATMRYESAIPLPDDDDTASSLVFIALIGVLTVSTTSAGIVWLLGPYIAAWTQVPTTWLWILPISILLVGSYQTFYNWSIRTRAFGSIARTRIGQSSSMHVVQLVAGNLGATGLVLGHVLGQAAGVMTLAIQTWRDGGLAFKSLSASRLSKVAYRYRHFPLVSTWSALFNAIGMQLPPVLIAGLFGPAAAGVYGLAHRITNVPMQLLGKAIGDVFFSRGAVAYREGRLGVVVREVHKTLVAIALPILVVLITLAPTLFAWVFGEVWREAGVVAQILAPWIFFVFVVSPLTRVFVIIEKQREGLVFQSILLASRAIALLSGAFLGTFKLGVILYAVTSAACWLGVLIWILRVTGNAGSDVISDFIGAGRRLLPLTVTLVLSLVIARICQSELLLLPGMVIAGFLVGGYYWGLWKTSRFKPTDHSVST